MFSILLLRQEDQPLLDIERFLQSRGYKLTVVTRLSDAVRSITNERPDFALLSTDMIPSRSGWLVSILNQLTGTVLIAGRISARTLALTRELKGIYLLEPPLTPFAVEQMLRRVERDHRKLIEHAPDLNKTHVWIMSALSDLALKTLCKPNATGSIEPVDRSSRVTCFRVQTSEISGYFILAFGQSRSLQSTWTSQLQSSLAQFLQSFDDMPVIDPSEEIHIEEVKFNEWTKEQAEFVRQAAHEDGELVLAFFKDKNPIRVQESARADHVEVGLEHLPGDSTVDFDVYIYLPRNARYVLYTSKGGTLYEAQKQKLWSEGVRSVHIHKRSLDEVRRHRARKFIDESSSAFR
jgi:hypothetical protein